jgi:hypothetical protein
MPKAATAARTAIPAATSHAAWNASRAASAPCGLPTTATKIAIPSTAPICRLMLTTALPVAERCCGRSAVAADRIVGRARPTPAPPTSMAGRITLT